MQTRFNFVLAVGLLVSSALLVVLYLPQPAAWGQTPSEPSSPDAITLQLEKFAEGFTQPVEIAHAGDSRLFVVEQPGVIYIVQSNGVKLATPFLNITTRVGSGGSEQGLLGLAFEPNDPKTFYVNYTNKQGDTVIARYKVLPNDANRADPNSEQIVLVVDQPASNHNGGDLAFGPDSELYIPLGDGGGGGDTYGNSQRLDRLLAKTLRIHVSGVTTYTIPAGNPFANDGDPNTRAEIWSYGWRNPWRFSFDRLTGDMYLGDVGQGAREEVDFEPKNTPGRNYGWNKCEGAIVYPVQNPVVPCPTNAGYTMPLFDYGRNSSDGGTTVTGGYVYRGTLYPNLVGHYLFADFGSGNFWTTLPDGQGGGVTTLRGKLGASNPSTFGEDAAGELYVADYGGTIYRVKDIAPVVTPSATPTPTTTGTVTPTPTGTLTVTPTFIPTTVTMIPTAPPPQGTPRAYLPQVRRAR